MSFFNKKDVLTILECHAPIYYCSRLLGLSTYHVDNPPSRDIDQKSKTKLSLSVGWLFYTFVLIGLYLVCFSFCIEPNKDNIMALKKFPYITVVGHILIIGFGAVTSGIIYAYCILDFKRFESILNQLKLIDNDLNDITGKDRVNYQLIYKFQMIMITSGTISFLVIVLYDAAMFLEIFHSSVVFIVVSYGFPYLSSSMVQFQFITGVYNILQRFKMINRFLTNISNVNKPTSRAVNMYNADQQSFQNTKPATSSFLISRDTNEDRPPSYTNLSNWTPGPKNSNEVTLGDGSNFSTDGGSSTGGNGDKKAIFTKSQTLEAMRNDEADRRIYKSLHHKMNEIFILHDKLCDISEVINDAFAVQLVACITSSFIVTLFGFFFETKVIFFAWGNNFRLIMIATSFIVWGVAAIIIIYINLRFCTAAREEAAESALIIHKILQNKPAFMLNDEIYYSKMKSFTLQVLHRKNTFHFNGLGLFRLDYTFIFSIVSAATSYLIVLLQFDLSKDLAIATGGNAYPNGTVTGEKVLFGNETSSKN